MSRLNCLCAAIFLIFPSIIAEPLPFPVERLWDAYVPIEDAESIGSIWNDGGEIHLLVETGDRFKEIIDGRIARTSTQFASDIPAPICCDYDGDGSREIIVADVIDRKNCLLVLNYEDLRLLRSYEICYTQSSDGGGTITERISGIEWLGSDANSVMISTDVRRSVRIDFAHVNTIEDLGRTWICYLDDGITGFAGETIYSATREHWTNARGVPCVLTGGGYKWYQNSGGIISNSGYYQIEMFDSSLQYEGVSDRVEWTGDDFTYVNSGRGVESIAVAKTDPFGDVAFSFISTDSIRLIAYTLPDFRKVWQRSYPWAEAPYTEELTWLEPYENPSGDSSESFLLCGFSNDEIRLLNLTTMEFNPQVYLAEDNFDALRIADFDGDGQVEMIAIQGAGIACYRPVALAVNDHLHAIPITANLLTAFPNPFNSSTTISYDIARPGFVRLGVYDAGGRSVGRLREGYAGAGKYSAVWNGGEVGSGTYFLNLEANGNFSTKPIILIR